MNKKKALAIAVMLYLLAMPGYSYAFQNEPEYVYYNGKPMAEMQFLNAGEGLMGKDGDGNDEDEMVAAAGYTLDPSLIGPVKSSTAYWAEMIGPKAQNGQPWQIYVTTEANLQNASAETTSVHAEHGETEDDADNYVSELLQNGKSLNRVTEASALNPPDGDFAFSTITIGQYLGAARKGAVDGWWVNTNTVLPDNEQASDFVGAFRHELGHALGIADRLDFLNDKGEPVDPDKLTVMPTYPNGEQRIAFSAEYDNPDSWNMHLVDQNLNPAKPGMSIVSAAGFEELKKIKPYLTKSDVFLVNNTYKGGRRFRQKGQGVLSGEDCDGSPGRGYLFRGVRPACQFLGKEPV